MHEPVCNNMSDMKFMSGEGEGVDILSVVVVDVSMMGLWSGMEWQSYLRRLWLHFLWTCRRSRRSCRAAVSFIFSQMKLLMSSKKIRI